MRKTLIGLGLLVLSAGVSAQTGIGTAVPNSALDVRGAMATAIRTFNSNTAITYNDQSLVFTGNAAATITLPDASDCTGRIYWIKNTNSVGAVPVLTVATTSSQLIEGLSTWQLDESNEYIRVISNGTGWELSAQQTPVRKTAALGGSWNNGGNRLTVQKSVGTTTNHFLPFITNSTEWMRLTTSGALGIGTTSPESKFHIVSDNDDAANDYILDDHGTFTQGILLRKIRGSFAAQQNLQSGDLISQFRFNGFSNGSFATGGGTGFDAYYLGTTTNNVTDLRWFTSNTEQLRITELGAVGIGSSSFSATPNAEKLLIDAGTSSSLNVISGRGEINNYLQLNIQNLSSGSTASSDVVATADNGDESFNYVDMGINSSAYSNSLIPILNGPSEAYFFSTGANLVIGNGTPSYDMIFFTNGFTAASERMRIAANGNIAIGTIAVPADKLTVAGITAPSTNGTFSLGTNAARWSQVWSANGVIQTSDARLKTNITSLEYGLTELLQMQPVSYNWKDKKDAKAKIGLIAQDIRKIIPEVVKGDESKEKLGMNYAELVTVLINALKTQQKQLENLKTELAILETENL
ncbi:MAG: tail fiber domain-containing protein [Gemmatimonadaceae bacterium]|nr:tail fiber domain-containing protein [Chitinophagaceae bacterium]